jgi:hypothetical protein
MAQQEINPSALVRKYARNAYRTSKNKNEILKLMIARST